MVTGVLATLWILGVCLVGIFLSRPLWVIERLVRARLFLAGVRSKYVQLGPFRMHYLVGGHGRPLVLVHGLAGKAENWVRIMPSLMRRGYRVYAIDLPGFGRSDRPDIEYSIAQQASVLHQFFDSQNLAQADLGGWSMGGWISLRFTLDHPTRVRRLFLADSPGIRFNLPFDPALFRAETREEARELLFLLTSERLLARFLAPDAVRRIRPIRWVVERTLKSMLTLRDLLDDRLGDIRVPVLIVWGKQDALIPLACAEEMHRRMPHSLLTIFHGCGHLAMIESSGRILPEIVRFLQAEPPLPASVREFSS
jgi:pimeloyl-ACP methyl ester carboxylesterase